MYKFKAETCRTDSGMKRLDDCNLNFNTVDNIF